MRTILRALPLASLAFAWAAPCRADVLDVPDRFPRIQAAIEAAQGGGIACVEASPAIRNVTLAGNVAKEGGGVDGLNSSPTITNAIVAFSRGGGVRAGKGSEPALRYACLFENQGGNLVDLIASGPGILEGDPLFADPEAGDYHLRSLGGRLARDPLGGKMAGPGQVPTTVAHWIVDAVHSPRIDAGDSSAVFEVEPEPHGGGLITDQIAVSLEPQ